MSLSSKNSGNSSIPCLPFPHNQSILSGFFIKILSDIPEYCTILIIEYHEINGIKNINKFKKIEKIIIDQGISCKFDTNDIPIEKQLVQWAKEEFHKNLSIENAKIIKEKCKNLDISHVRNELKKICNYEKEATISKKSLEIISDFSEKSKIFDLPKSIFSQNTKKSFEILNSLIKNKEDPVVILSVICSEYVDLLRAKILSQKSSAMEKIIKNFDYKNKDGDYVNASGFEALIGYLYLKEQNERLDYIINKSIEIIELGN